MDEFGLAQLAASQVAEYLDAAAIGATLPVDSSAALCATLELLIPAILRHEHPEWDRESIDGFFFASALKTDQRSAAFAGTCILITDQSVTPFTLLLSLQDSGTFASVTVKLGESGGGVLGISGPPCASTDATELLAGLVSRVDRIDWVYEAEATAL